MTLPGQRTASGYVNLLKPPGVTSRRAVASVRRITGAAKAGHAGALDPAAAGVLVVALEQATRLASYVTGAAKSYRAEVTFGVATDTLDAEGRVTARISAAALTADQICAALERFRGRVAQTPPMYSALHRGGERLYRLARAGKTVDRPTRWVVIESLELLRFSPSEHPRALIDVTCSRGTYLRSLAADLGAAVDLPAHLSFLVRTRVGDFRLLETTTLDELAARTATGDLASAIVPPDAPLGGMPRVVLNPEQETAVRHGQAVTAPRQQTCAANDTAVATTDEVAMYDESGVLLGIAHIDGSVMLRPRLVLTSEERD